MDKLKADLIKISSLAKAILLDKDNIPAESIALAMAEEILKYSADALECIE